MQSDLIPPGPPVDDLFANLGHNWTTLWPALAVLFGVIFGGFVFRKVIKYVRGED
ncbi:hypothetical protein D3C76_389400 [compost metagenome]